MILTPPFILVLESSDQLEITPSRYGEWFDHVLIGGELYWDREGDVRIVTLPIIANALRAYSDYTQLVAAGRLIEFPEGVKYIRWEQTILTVDRFKSSDKSGESDDAAYPPK